MAAPLLHHLALRTASIEAVALFYQQILGLAVVRDARPRSLWLRLGGGALLMIEALGPGEPAPDPASMEMFAFAVTDAEKARVRGEAVERGCFDGESAWTVYLRDPDGRRLGVSTWKEESSA